MDQRDEKNLKFRYLAWLYKTTKEAFDSYERKLTQLDIDQVILKEVEKELKGSYLPHEKRSLEKHVNDFRNYITQKEKASLRLKYKGKKINTEFIFLDVKLDAIEKTIKKELGAEALEDIKNFYQDEMVARILESKGKK